MDGAGACARFGRSSCRWRCPGWRPPRSSRFVYCWNEFLFALSFTLGPERQTVPVAIALFRGQYQVPWGQMLAAAVVATAPVAALVLVFQRRIVPGPHGGRGERLTMASIRLEDVEKIYPNGHAAVRGLDLAIADGELLVLVGPSGCGKSTALRMIAGLETPTAGRILIGDRDVTDAAAAGRATSPWCSRATRCIRTRRCVRTSPSACRCAARPGRDRRASRAGRLRRWASTPCWSASRAAVRRPAAARGAGPRDRARAEVFLFDEPLSNLDAEAARGDARRAGAAAPPARRDDRVRDPRSGGGDDARRAGGGACATGGCSSWRHADGGVPPPGDGLCGRIRRLAGDEPARRRGVGRAVAGPGRIRVASAPARAGRVTLGVRPHDVAIVPASTGDVARRRVDVVEPRGSELLAGVRPPRRRRARAGGAGRGAARAGHSGRRRRGPPSAAGNGFTGSMRAEADGVAAGTFRCLAEARTVVIYCRPRRFRRVASGPRMHLTLLESDRSFLRSTECAVVSILAHIAAVWVVVGSTQGARQFPTDEREARVFFLLPPDRGRDHTKADREHPLRQDRWRAGWRDRAHRRRCRDAADGGLDSGPALRQAQRNQGRPSLRSGRIAQVRHRVQRPR